MTLSSHVSDRSVPSRATNGTDAGRRYEASADRTAAPPPAAVRLLNVRKDYRIGRDRTVEAVRAISLEIGQGEFVALIGPSGCGKSTVLRMIAGLEPPTTGTISVLGGEPSAATRSHRLGVAFQDHALLPWLTVTDNVALPFKVAGLPVDRARVSALLSLVGLEGFSGARPRHLSGGMRQRVSIARALALRPEVLLLDEPFGSLDAVTRRRLNFEVQAIWTAQSIATLLITHSVDEAVLLADRIVVLSERPGTVREVVHVGFPRPRGPDLMRTSEFHALTDSLTAALDSGLEQGPA
jgi:NitT/TauT family transport system ATP-binding protein